MLKSIDPQKRANEIMTAIEKKVGKRTKAYWQTVGDLAATIQFDMGNSPDIPPALKAQGAKKLTARFRADMMKVAAIMEETAAQHITLLKQSEAPSVADDLKKQIGDIFMRGD